MKKIVIILFLFFSIPVFSQVLDGEGKEHGSLPSNASKKSLYDKVCDAAFSSFHYIDACFDNESLSKEVCYTPDGEIYFPDLQSSLYEAGICTQDTSGIYDWRDFEYTNLTGQDSTILDASGIQSLDFTDNIIKTGEKSWLEGVWSETKNFAGQVWQEATDINTEYHIVERGLGVLQGVFGAGEILLGCAAELIPEPTAATKVFGTIAIVHGIDTTWAGLKQIWSGEFQNTYTEKSIAGTSEMLGASPETAGWIGTIGDMAVSLLNPINIGKNILQQSLKETLEEGSEKAIREGVEEVAEGSAKIVSRSIDIDFSKANYAQKTYSETFDAGGKFAYKNIDDIAQMLKKGDMQISDIPIDYIVRDENVLILNTRSSQALERAGIPRSKWNFVDRTGEKAYEARLTGQLERNELTSEGISSVKSSK